MTQRSEVIADLIAALSKFQGAMKSVSKTSTNPFFHSRYADLDAVWDACRKPLSDNGLAVVQTTCQEDGRLFLDTVLYHTSGQFISGRYPITPMRQDRTQGWVDSNDPQAIGSAITYARRYSMSAILGVSADEDDDAERATAKTKAADVQVRKAAQADNGTASEDNRYHCFEHNATWTKRTREDGASWYSHKQGSRWCNMKDAKLDAAPEQAQEGAQEPRTAQVDKEGPSGAAAEFEALVLSLPKPTTVQILAANAKRLGYLTPESIRAVVGPSETLVNQEALNAAQHKLIGASRLRPQEVEAPHE